MPRKANTSSGASAPAQSAGGLGGIRDVRLAARALAESWPVPPEVRPSIVARLVAVVRSRKSSPREVAAAARALIAATKVSLDAYATSSQLRAAEDLAREVAELRELITPPTPPGSSPDGTP